MRRAFLLVPLLLSCRALNPAFENDGGGTTTVESSTGSAMTTTTGASASADGSSGGTTTAPDPDPDSSTHSESFSSSSGFETEIDPKGSVYIPLRFDPPATTLENFVVRVRLDQHPALVGVSAEFVEFFDDATGASLPHEIIAENARVGSLDAWVRLDTWPQGQTSTINLVVGSPAPPSDDLWSAFEHVWYLEEGDGPIDAASGFSGEYIGYSNPGTHQVMGVVGQARAFEGAQLARLDSVEPGGDFVVSAWVWVTQLPANGNAPMFGRIASMPNGGPEFEWSVAISATGALTLRIDGPGGVTIDQDESGLQDGWHHYGVAFEGTTVELFVDGMRTLGVPGSSIPAFTESLQLGGWYENSDQGNNGFYGAIDQVMWIDGPVPDEWFGLVFATHSVPTSLYEVLDPVYE